MYRLGKGAWGVVALLLTCSGKEDSPSQGHVEKRGEPVSDNAAGVSGNTNLLANVGLILAGLGVFSHSFFLLRLVLGLESTFLDILAVVGTPVLTVNAAILGHVALRQVKKRGDKGRGLAITAVILVWVIVGLIILGIPAFLVP